MKCSLTDFATHGAAIAALRKEVFVIEQQVPLELEQDGFDPQCRHAVLFLQDTLIATGRITPLGHLGRIAVAKALRGRGHGARIVAALESAAREMGLDRVTLAAQVAAIPFYENLGYRGYGEFFLDAGIEHLHMEKVFINTAP